MSRSTPFVSRQISSASAAVLAIAGLALLFAADDIMPRLVSGFPSGAAWVGQLLAAAWLAVATLNWFSRGTVLGGIYGRPVVMTNAVLYFISTTALMKIASGPRGSVTMSLVLATAVVFAAVYAGLLFRGPLASDLPSANSPR